VVMSGAKIATKTQASTTTSPITAVGEEKINSPNSRAPFQNPRKASANLEVGFDMVMFSFAMAFSYE
jgi:hypothetical protein